MHARHTFSGKSRRALALELRVKGVSDEHSRAALEQVDDESEEQRARELVQRKLRTLSVPADGPGRGAAVRKLVGLLARRGYGPSMALSVVRDELVVAGADTDDLVDEGDEA